MRVTYNCDNVTLRKHILQLLDATCVKALFGIYESACTPGAMLTLRNVVVVEPQQLLAVEALQPFEHPVSDAPSPYGTDNLSLEVVGVASDLRDVPVVGNNLFVSRSIVADEVEYSHDDVFGYGDDIASGDLRRAKSTRKRYEMEATDLCHGELVLVRLV